MTNASLRYFATVARRGSIREAAEELHDPVAVAELRRVLEEFKLYEDFYKQRGRDPSHAIPQDVFVANVKARRA